MEKIFIVILFAVTIGGCFTALPAAIDGEIAFEDAKMERYQENLEK